MRFRSPLFFWFVFVFFFVSGRAHGSAEERARAEHWEGTYDIRIDDGPGTLTFMVVDESSFAVGISYHGDIINETFRVKESDFGDFASRNFSLRLTKDRSTPPKILAKGSLRQREFAGTQIAPVADLGPSRILTKENYEAKLALPFAGRDGEERRIAFCLVRKPTSGFLGREPRNDLEETKLWGSFSLRLPGMARPVDLWLPELYLSEATGTLYASQLDALSGRPLQIRGVLTGDGSVFEGYRVVGGLGGFMPITLHQFH